MSCCPFDHSHLSSLPPFLPSKLSLSLSRPPRSPSPCRSPCFFISCNPLLGTRILSKHGASRPTPPSVQRVSLVRLAGDCYPPDWSDWRPARAMAVSSRSILFLWFSGWPSVPASNRLTLTFLRPIRGHRHLRALAHPYSSSQAGHSGYTKLLSCVVPVPCTQLE